MKNGNYCTMLGQGNGELGRDGDTFLNRLFFSLTPFPLPHWKCISLQWRNCSSTAFTKIILVISTQVSIMLLNIHPTLLTVDRFHVVLLLFFPSSVLNRILCMTYHMLQMMKLWCEDDDVITVCKWCSSQLRSSFTSKPRPHLPFQSHYYPDLWKLVEV